MFEEIEALDNKIDQFKHLKYLDILDMMSIKVSFLCCFFFVQSQKIKKKVENFLKNYIFHHFETEVYENYALFNWAM